MFHWIFGKFRVSVREDSSLSVTIEKTFDRSIQESLDAFWIVRPGRCVVIDKHAAIELDLLQKDRRRERYSFISENPRSPDTEVAGALTMRSRSTKVKGHTSRMKASGCSATRRSRTVCRTQSAIVFELRHLKGHTVDSIRVVLAV